ncbi:MAG: AAA family ATPase [Herpetosiphonaceae bacterium]|nr:AAA family ATPase [Herpetosiphonaceae bacterium]
MFKKLDQLLSGTLFILTGLPGSGKSHLAASARRSGTIWILDTEGASQSLLGKPGIHPDIQAVQTLSLKQLLDAMREILRMGKPGDTVILDSISKVINAMRQHAQQRAGGDTDRKTALAYDEHASINRNMQSIYTGLTELKHAGFHIIMIGHLAKKYQASGSALTDVGLRVLADENINYEADAILLVERTGQRRSITPIIKPPRQRHLQLAQEYPASLATLFPDQVPLDNDKRVVTEPLGRPPQTAADEQEVEAVAPANVTTFPATESRTRPNTPKTPEEAEQRFFARWGQVMGGTNWSVVQKFLGYRSPRPTTIEEWIDLAAEVRDHNARASVA